MPTRLAVYVKAAVGEQCLQLGVAALAAWFHFHQQDRPPVHAATRRAPGINPVPHRRYQVVNRLHRLSLKGNHSHSLPPPAFGHERQVVGVANDVQGSFDRNVRRAGVRIGPVAVALLGHAFGHLRILLA